MTSQRPGEEKLAVVMVGLPARGKTFVARKLQRYLSWLGYRTRWVNVGDYRRARGVAKQPASYFAPDNQATRGEREGFAMAALDDLLESTMPRTRSSSAVELWPSGVRLSALEFFSWKSSAKIPQ